MILRFPDLSPSKIIFKNTDARAGGFVDRRAKTSGGGNGNLVSGRYRLAAWMNGVIHPVST
jgi:hypothetical protein